MITYSVTSLGCPVPVYPGDRFNLTITDSDGEQKLVCSKEITIGVVITHWACVTIPDAGMGYFVGTEKLVEVLGDLFPGAQLVKEIPTISLDKPSS